MKFGLTVVALAAVLADTVSASWGISGANTGIDPNTGARPFRLPIQDLMASGPMWDLYVQALSFWQTTDQKNMFSWYGIGGIHGLPQQPWDGADGAGYYVGYCKHASITFPTWHRPYMALHEQIISIFAHQIADTYPDDKKATYRQAADQLRIPYWDWSVDAKVPQIMNTPQVTVNAAWGSYTLDNPLYRYNFNPYNGTDLDGIYSGANWTVRAPDDNTQSQPAKANQALSANQQQFHDGMYQLFSSQPKYELFSNTGANNGKGGYQSIENLHNIVHDTIGGTMAYLWVSAFDPIFWLHHANVDRLFAIWQAINPDSFVTPQANALGSYTVAPNSVEDADTPLEPFAADDKGKKYTSNTARYTKTFGYAYREVVDWNVTAQQLTVNVKKIVNQIYNPNGAQAAKRSVNHRRDVPQLNQKSATAASRQYVLNVVVDKSKINSTMLINFKLSNQTFGTLPVNMGGTANNPKSRFATPGKQAGQVALTHALLKAGANLADVNGTLSRIAKDMSWTGETPSGAKIMPADLTDGTVQIQVSTRSVTQTSPEEEFPVYGDWTELASSELGKVATKIIGQAADEIKQKISTLLDDTL